MVRRSAAFRLAARLDVAAGEVVAVMGPSGAGKSTLLGALAGFVTIDAGRIRLGDLTVAEGAGRRAHSLDPARRGIALLGQDPRLFPHLSALENVAFGMRAQGAPRAQARADAAAWLARVGLADAAFRRPAALSGGQQQRVALARALAARPRLVLLDEPLTSLDPETADGIREIVRGELECTAIVVTHAAIDAVTLAHRLVILEDGGITHDGPVREVLAHPRTAFGASLAGLVRVEGVLRGGSCRAGGVDIAGERSPGLREGDAVAAVFRPDAARIVPAGALDNERGQDAASSRWRTRIRRLEPTLAGARVHTDEPAIAVDVALEALARDGLAPGLEVAVSLPASAVRIVSAAPAGSDHENPAPTLAGRVPAP